MFDQASSCPLVLSSLVLNSREECKNRPCSYVACNCVTLPMLAQAPALCRCGIFSTRYCVLIFKSTQWIFLALVTLMAPKPPNCVVHHRSIQCIYSVCSWLFFYRLFGDFLTILRIKPCSHIAQVFACLTSLSLVTLSRFEMDCFAFLSIICYNPTTPYCKNFLQLFSAAFGFC